SRCLVWGECAKGVVASQIQYALLWINLARKSSKQVSKVASNGHDQMKATVFDSSLQCIQERDADFGMYGDEQLFELIDAHKDMSWRVQVRAPCTPVAGSRKGGNQSFYFAACVVRSIRFQHQRAAKLAKRIIIDATVKNPHCFTQPGKKSCIQE